MEFDFLSPLSNEILGFIKELSSQHLGSKIVVHTKEDFPDSKKIRIAIIGILENRGDVKASEEVNLTYIRKELYQLFPGNWRTTIADFGNIKPGDTIEDTYFALQKVTSSLLKNKIIPIVIGGSQDLTYPLYRAYDNLEQMVNLVAIDSKFDLGKEEEILSNNSYLTKIILNEPNNLFNYSNVGYQSYYNSQEEVDLIDKLYFDAYRLGEVCNNPSIAEPVLRDADIVSVDLFSVKSSDSANFHNFTPNGFSGKEICSLARYAGISDRVSSFGIFNHQNSSQEALLIAQIIWYFIEGVQYRSNEYPFGTKDNYTKYIVTLEDELIFFKSNVTERWWIEIKTNNKFKKVTLLPCTHDDYLAACNGEVPERWLKAQRKDLI
jgi:arginase family enzyme